MKRCHNCYRGSMTSQSRSHSNIATKRKQNINLQWKLVDDERVKLCTKCIRTMKYKAQAA